MIHLYAILRLSGHIQRDSPGRLFVLLLLFLLLDGYIRSWAFLYVVQNKPVGDWILARLKDVI